MRIPKESQLSREQKEICYAPSEGTTLVVGPPGSGKTIVALFRSRALRKGGETVRTVMYNKVLGRFTEVGETFDSWIDRWWRGITGKSFPKAVPEEGQRWRPKDYASAVREVRSTYKVQARKHGHWGHVVLDEAQDFPPDAHKLLFTVQQRIFSDVDEPERPSLLILADENQRITAANSNLQEIADAYLLPGEELYELRKNYRNTREIARFAASFYADASSGLPDLPSRRGDPPKIVHTDGINDAVDRIQRHAELHENEEIGVLVMHEWTRKKLFNKLNSRLIRNSIRVQTYSSKQRTDVEDLEFDKPGVTVLCFASSKGLEFDTVFLPQLQTMPADPENRDIAKMNLYVMCSRARTNLQLMFEGDPEQSDVWKLFPPQHEESGDDLYELL